MNNKQRIIFLYILGFFLCSIIYIPETVSVQNGVRVFQGYTFLWKLMFEVDIKQKRPSVEDRFLEWITPFTGFAEGKQDSPQWQIQDVGYCNLGIASFVAFL